MEQAALPLVVKDEIPDSVVAACKDFKGAIRLCIECCGLERKEVAFSLNIQDAHLSRMLADANGGDERHFPVNMLQGLMNLCGNEIPLRWLALQRGFGLFRLKSALEIENEALKAQLADQKREQQIMIKLLKEIRP